MKAKFMSMLLLVAAMGITSCSDNTIVVEEAPNNGSANPIVAYANIKLSMPGGMATRSGENEEFEDGTVAENDVKNLLILFYDEAGTCIGKYDGVDFKNNGDTNKDDDIESKLAWNDAEVVPIEMFKPGDPISALAFLNYDTSWNLTDLALEDALSITKDVYQVNLENTDCFVMSNAGYYDTDGKYQYATKVKGYIYPTAEEAKSSKSITIYVERVAARVDVEITSTDVIEPVKVLYKGNEYNLTFAPQSWGLTATEKKTYLIKKSEDLSSFSIENHYPEDFDEWVSYDNHRTFWAMSPSYAQTAYPENSDGITSTSSLKYIDFATLSKSSLAAENKLTLDNDKYTGSAYTFEHTFPATVLNGDKVNPYAVPTSIVLYGTYEIAPAADSPEQTVDFAKGFYARQIGGGETPTIYIYTEEDLLGEFIELQNLIASDANGSNLVKDNNNSIFTIANTKKEYIGDNDYARSNIWTLQLNENTNGTYYYHSSNGWEEITEDNLDAVNEALQKNVGTATFYAQRHAYFYIPIAHYKRSDYKGDFHYSNGSENETTKIIDNLTGEFGVVRNHIYKLKVNKIAGLGYGQPGEGGDQPGEGGYPLPDPDNTKQYYFYATVEILSWHVMDMGVDL